MLTKSNVEIGFDIMENYLKELLIQSPKNQVQAAHVCVWWELLIQSPKNQVQAAHVCVWWDRYIKVFQEIPSNEFIETGFWILSHNLTKCLRLFTRRNGTSKE